MRIIGIDPGLAITGYCVLDVDADSIDAEYTIVTTGSIQTSKLDKNCERLLEIHHDINNLVRKYKPKIAAVEESTPPDNPIIAFLFATFVLISEYMLSKIFEIFHSFFALQITLALLQHLKTANN